MTGIVPISVLILAVLGSIVLGLATPTEASGVGALGALVLTAVYRRLNWDMLKGAVFQSVRTSSMVLTLLVGSAIFSGVCS